MSTKVKDERSSLTIFWKIEKFSVWENDCDGNEIESPNLTPRVLQGSCFQLFLYKKGSCRDQRELWFKLQCEGDAFDFSMDYEISLLSCCTSPLVLGYAKIHSLEAYALNTVISSKNQNGVFINNRSSYLPEGTLTIQCRFWKSLGNFWEEEFIFLGTRIEAFEMEHVWPILGLGALELNREVTIPLTCQFFNLANIFLLKFSFKGESLDLASACLELVPVSIRTAGLRASVKVSVMQQKGRLQETIDMLPRYKFYYDTTSRTYVQDLAIPISSIATRKDLLLEDTVLMEDVLNLNCKITYLQAISAVQKNFDGLHINK